MAMVHTMKRVQDGHSLAAKTTKRRQYDAAFKRHLVELSLAPGASVAKIALDHQLNANVLFKWRRHRLRELARSTPKPAALLPVTMLQAQGTAVQACVSAQKSPSPRRRPPVTQTGGVIEIELALARVRLTGVVDLATLRVVIDALSQR